MLLLAALAVHAAPVSPKLEAIAAVRIERPASVSAKAWERLPSQSKREVTVRDEQGRPILLRLVENQ